MNNTFKAGKYFVGDPCYIFEKSWTDICKSTNYFKNNNVYNFFGEKCYIGSTYIGDGTYTDNNGKEYGVDAGLIGVLPISLIKIDNVVTEKQIEESNFMHIIEFDKDFIAESHHGVFHFGDIIIDTMPIN